MKFKQLFHIIFLSIIVSYAHGEKLVDGYIITKKNDTLYGKIKFQQFKGDAFYTPFNMGMFAISVTFVPKDGGEKEYMADELIGFDFDYKEEHYEYRSLKIDRDGLQIFQSDDAPSFVFAQRLVNTEPLKFYKFRFNENVFRKYKGRASKDNYYFAYYVSNKNHLVQLNRTYKNDEVFTMLREDLKLEENFINTLPKKSSSLDLTKILSDYNIWKKNN